MKKLDYLKITILCENYVGNIKGIGEHGLSAYIETREGTYLFDTGQGLGLHHNARFLKKDLGRADKIILSHGHYDHTGGLMSALEVTGPIDVLSHPSVFGEKYKIVTKDGEEERGFIGIPYRRELLEAKGGRFVLDTGFKEIGHGAYMTGRIPMVTEFEKGDPRLFVKEDDRFEYDVMPDDQAMVFTTTKGMVVFLGCAHAGMVNTLYHIQNMLGSDQFYAILGGTHLGFLTEEQQLKSIEVLKQLDISYIGVSHCTGIKVAQKLSEEFGERYSYASVGSMFEI